MASRGIDSTYFSAISAEPEMHPMVQAGMSMLPYGLLGTGIYFATNKSYGNEGLRLTDLIYASTRNFGIRSPAGIFNTFRAPEGLSTFTSPVFKGFDLVGNGLSGSNVYQYTVDNDFVNNNSTIKQLIDLAEEETDILKMKMAGDDWRLVFEQERDSVKGSLFFQETSTSFDADGNPVKKGIAGSEIKISSNISAIDNTSAPDFYDLLSSDGRREQLNPLTRAAYSNQDLGSDVKMDSLYRNPKGKISQYGFVPSVSGPIRSLRDLKNRSVIPTSYLTFGIARINKLISSTLDQIPYAKNLFSKIGEITNSSIYTRPEPFHKQFMSFGLKISSVGAAYMGLRTIDHYRREFGIPGHLVASGAVALGAGALTRSLVNRQSNFMSNLPKQIALGTFALQMLPGFSQGTTEGLATTLVNADIARAYIGKYSGMSLIRRGIEGLFPGFTDLSTGALLGVGLAVASYSGLGKYLVRNQKEVLPQMIRDRIGFTAEATHIPEGFGHTKNKVFFERLRPVEDLESFKAKYEGGHEFFDRYQDFADLRARDDYKELFRKTVGADIPEEMGSINKNKLTYIFDKIEGMIAQEYNVSPQQAKLIGKKYFYGLSQEAQMEYYKVYQENNPLNDSLIKRMEIIKERYKGSGIGGKVAEKLELVGAQMYHAFFGASMIGDKFEKATENIGVKTVFGRAGTLVVGGLLLHQALTGSVFGTMETVDDIKAEYSGDKLVEVKRGRWWEGGGSPIEGKDTHYFRPHKYVSLMNKAEEKVVWGDEYNKYNPITKFFLKNFTYHLEEKNYYDRPYPVTSPAFENVPIIGPLLGATVGSIIKPVKLMHEDEFMRVNDSGNVEYMYRKEPGSMEGEMPPPGPPIMPNNMLYRYGQVQYQFRELEGITGYAKNVMTKMFTGRETLGTMKQVMAASGQMDDPIRQYWDMELGGALFLSEAVRRIFPRERSEIDYYNPITNSMPSYVPDRFKSGDPYTKAPNASVRLPGPGYEAVNPDVRGLDPEDYPLIHKYKISADLSPKSSKTFEMRAELYERRAAGLTTEHENRIMDQVAEQHSKMLSGYQDFDYKENAIKTPGLSYITSGVYKNAEEVLRRVSAPAEYLIPAGFRPVQKLEGKTRDIIQEYEYNRLYGGANAFWDAPWRDWLKPSLVSAGRFMGIEDPGVQERERVQQLFDDLQFVKYMGLAENADNTKDRQRYLRLANRTSAGVNPQGSAYSVYMALPDEEKKYFESFATASESQKERIRDILPAERAELYENVWSRMQTEGGGGLYYDGGKEEINVEYMKQRMPEIVSRLKEGGELPPVDWIGWRNEVDLEDIKIKYIDSLGQDIHNHDMWENQLRRTYRRPYLDQSEQFLIRRDVANRNDLRRMMHGNLNVDMSDININTDYSQSTSTASFNYNYDRTPSILSAMRARLEE